MGWAWSDENVCVKGENDTERERETMNLFEKVIKNNWEKMWIKSGSVIRNESERKNKWIILCNKR